MKTFILKPKQAQRKWYLFNAENKVLGRFATKVAQTLLGKTRTDYTPNVDSGDYVIIINSDKIKADEKKKSFKVYYHHSFHPGGLKRTLLGDQMKKDSTQVIYRAVWGMLPKSKLGRKVIKKLFVYKDQQHPHQAQKPEPIQW